MFFRADALGVFVERPAGGQIQIERRLETERPASARHGVAPVKQRHRRDHHAAIRQALRVDDGREIVRPLKFYFQTGRERLLHEREGLRIRRVDVLHKQFAVIDRIRERDHAGSEDVVCAQLARFHDVETPDDVGYEAADLLEIPDVIANQLRVCFRQLGRAHGDVAIVKLFAGEEFACGRGGQFEAFARFDFVQLLEDAITLRPLRLPKNVEAAEPRREGESSQEQNRNRPAEEAAFSPRTPVSVLVANVIPSHLDPPALGAIRFQAGRAASKDVPQPQVRAAFGFSM